MRRIIVLVTVAALMVVLTMFTAGAALAVSEGSCEYFYNPSAGNFVVQKFSASGNFKLYSTDHPPPSCEFGGTLPL